LRLSLIPGSGPAAQHQPDRIDRKILALASQQEARGWAIAGDYDRCAASLDRAADLLGEAERRAPTRRSRPTSTTTGGTPSKTKRQALTEAMAARDNTDLQDDLDAMGGILSFPLAKQHYYAASTAALVSDGSAAERYAQQAISVSTNRSRPTTMSSPSGGTTTTHASRHQRNWPGSCDSSTASSRRPTPCRPTNRWSRSSTS
jgi:hypothetical protein